MDELRQLVDGVLKDIKQEEDDWVLQLRMGVPSFEVYQNLVGGLQAHAIFKQKLMDNYRKIVKGDDNE